MASNQQLLRPEGRITSLETDPRRASTVRIHVGGRPYCTVPADLALAERLDVGLEIDEGQHERLCRAADVEAAFRTGLRSLEARPYARTDLGRRLVRKGHPRAAVETALERVAGLGLLDDAAFAINFVQTRAARGRGPMRLMRDLAAMGVERSMVDAAIAAHWPDGTDDAEAPLALATRRAAQLGGLSRPVKRRRLLAFLARRGYSGRTVNAVVARVLTED
jgi:regulatory protein